jgi:hypothetical protein
MNTTGPISLAGATAGQSIALEIGRTATTTTSLNDANVRTLAGVASGAIVIPTNFYGKSFATGPTTGVYYAGYRVCTGAYLNTITRVNNCGALIGTEGSTGTGRQSLAGAAANTTTGVYFGGTVYCCCSQTNYRTATRLNKCGALLGSTCIGPIYGLYGEGGASVGVNAMFFSGCRNGGSNQVSRINSSGAIVGSCTNVGSPRYCNTGASVGSVGAFYGGFYAGIKNTVTRINACAALVGAETSIGTARFISGGAKASSVAVFYGGAICTVTSNLVTRINACGALVGSQTTLTNARRGPMGANIGVNAVFFGGSTTAASNIVQRVNNCGALVGSVTTAGTPRFAGGGSGL